MLYKTRGIVFNHIKYSETSLIVTIYTERYGRQAYIVNGVRGKKARIKANMFQSLFLFIYFNPNARYKRQRII
jgi:DNA repair protein RecO (recombination protein O)